ncbi:MAG: hypothetical protein OEL19_06765 [Sulfurimonas sp.]|nr:hypothetical protein [Sulfurimonas sp.]
MKTITAYQCCYCRKIAKTPKTIERHEMKCFSNPINKACGSCENQQLCFTKGVSNCTDYLPFYSDDEEVQNG